VQQQPTVHVDETNWREGQQHGWLWVAASPVATSFRIDRSRSRHALHQRATSTVLGASRAQSPGLD
jgi:hypothetical protein